MGKITFKLRHKETKEEIELEFKTTKNPLKMMYRLQKTVRKLKKYDKTHDLIDVESDDPRLESMMKTEIHVQKESVETTGEPDLHGIPDISKKTVKKKLKKMLKRK